MVFFTHPSRAELIEGDSAHARPKKMGFEDSRCYWARFLGNIRLSTELL